MSFTPSQQVLERYADVLINFALGGGEGIAVGTAVAEAHLERMLVELSDPLDGRPVGAEQRL